MSFTQADRARGGHARAKALTRARRKEIGLHAIRCRWLKRDKAKKAGAK